MGRRILLFFVINIAIITTISILLSVLGVEHYITPYGLNLGALLIFCLAFGMGGAFISLWMSKWAAKTFMGVKIIKPGAPGEAGRLVQRVHDIARLAQLPKMPEVGIYSSPELNAFATGPSKSNSLVAVSEGLLRNMNENEVEGVLAHEVSHIANGDMVTMTLIQGVVNAFVMFLARIIAFAITSATSRDGERGIGSSPLAHMFIVIALQMLLMPIGMLVVAYVSRKREFRADAGSAKLVGKEKMIVALQRLQKNMGYVDESHASFTSLKISGRPSKFAALFSTHPPLKDRIAALEIAM